MDLFKLYLDENYNLIVQISIWLIILLILIILVYFLVLKKVYRYNLVKLDIKLGNVGSAEFRPNKTDLQIAHKIWTELITRKAAIPIDQYFVQNLINHLIINQVKYIKCVNC